jgi:hypothetical protein
VLLGEGLCAERTDNAKSQNDGSLHRHSSELEGASAGASIS